MTQRLPEPPEPDPRFTVACAFCGTTLWHNGPAHFVDARGSNTCSNVPGGVIEPYIRARYGSRHPTGIHWPTAADMQHLRDQGLLDPPHQPHQPHEPHEPHELHELRDPREPHEQG